MVALDHRHRGTRVQRTGPSKKGAVKSRSPRTSVLTAGTLQDARKRGQRVGREQAGREHWGEKEREREGDRISECSQSQLWRRAVNQSDKRSSHECGGVSPADSPPLAPPHAPGPQRPAACQ